MLADFNNKQHVNPDLQSALLCGALIDSQEPDQLIVDDPKRLRYRPSIWKRLFTQDKKRFYAHLQEKVGLIFQHRYSFTHTKDFKKAWQVVVRNKIWDPSSPLTLGLLRAIDRCFVYHGPGMTVPKPRRPDADAMVEKIVHFLLHGGEEADASLMPIPKKKAAPSTFSFFKLPPFNEIYHTLKTFYQVFKAIVWQKDEGMLNQFKKELQYEMDHLLAHPPRNPKEEFIWRAFLGNVIALLPFTYPKSGDRIIIPILQDQKCRPVEYKIEVIPLTVTDLSTPMTALGMTPVNDKEAPPILTYLATTYPSGEGFAGTLLADFPPGKSVGEPVYERNRSIINRWMKDKKEVWGVGTSLGGAMMMHTYLHHSEKLGRLDLYNPPGLYPECWKRPLQATCPFNIYHQHGDIIPKLGAWPTSKNVSLYKVFANQEGVHETPGRAHAQVFTGLRDLTVIKQSPAKENQDPFRLSLTRCHRFFGPVVYYPVKLPLLAMRTMQRLRHCLHL